MIKPLNSPESSYPLPIRKLDETLADRFQSIRALKAPFEVVKVVGFSASLRNRAGEVHPFRLRVEVVRTFGQEGYEPHIWTQLHDNGFDLADTLWAVKEHPELHRSGIDEALIAALDHIQLLIYDKINVGRDAEPLEML